MDRRSFVGGLIAAGGIGALSARIAHGAATGTIDVADRFGFVGDGRTDNADAFHRWAAAVNQAGGGNYVFPPGRYYIRRYRAPGGPQPENPTIHDCDGLTISGAGAVVVLNGNFHRSARPGPRGRPLGDETGAFMPFVLRRCRNVRISGFEIDGGVRGMSRDPSINEAYSYLIALHGCSAVVLEDLNLHHSQTDAVLLYEDGLVRGRRPGIACRDIVLNRVRCSNNARGGLAPLQVYGLTCTDCAFNGSSYGLGKYLSHAPGFGVDVEPDYSKPEEIDIKTGNLEFRRCAFDGNGSAFLAAYPDTYRGYLRLIDCTSSNPERKPNHMIFSWPGALIEGGRHDCGDGTIWTSWEGVGGGDLTIRNTEIRASGPYGLFHAHNGHYLRLEGVKLVGTHRGPGSHGWLLAVHGSAAGRRNLVRGCEIFVPRARKSPEHPYDYEVSFHDTVSEENVFTTDLPAAGGQHFCTEYGAGASARADRYQGTAPGPDDSFRPAHMSVFDTRRPYSQA